MHDFPLVTIVVISYNQGKYIKENLDSIKSQTYNNIQLIVADDASSDDSVQIFDEWLLDNDYNAEKNYHKDNKGLATTLNECVEIANGKYIKLIAADDFLNPESIEKCVLRLQKYGQEYGMVFTDTHTIDENSNITSDNTDYDSLVNPDPLIFKKDLLTGNKIAALTALMRLDVLKETGKYNSKFIVEDYYRWLKINEKYLILYIPEKLAYYRLHEQNISFLKKDRISFETLLLQIQFDKEGFVKNIINHKLNHYYINGMKIPNYLVKAYSMYPYKNKRLNLALKYKLPSKLFKLFNNVY